MSFEAGSLLRLRNRDWVVVGDPLPGLLRVRPVGGRADEETEVLLDLEAVGPATFPLPSANSAGDWFACQLLHDAFQLGSRSSAGPLRSLSRIAVEPRPYQLVPLLMALKLDPVRMLIADDVGIGKTIEAGLIARELLDRGEVERLLVFCPPHLADQWQSELSAKFNIDAQLILSGTASRLERQTSTGQSVLDLHPYNIMSVDYAKSQRIRDVLLRDAPELIIVDEAHTCTAVAGGGHGRKLRYDLIQQLAKDQERHILLLTATPHSGKSEAFRSLLQLLDPEFASLPESLAGPQNEIHRRRIAQRMVLRRRGDIKDYLGTATAFPTAESTEATYSFIPEYRELFERVLRYATEKVVDPASASQRDRVRYWALLAMLRTLGSSPKAAAASLRKRAPMLVVDSREQTDQIGSAQVLDEAEEDAEEWPDAEPGSDASELDPEQARDRKRLLDFAREADKLAGKLDAKVQKAASLIRGLLDEDFHPIVFCRFIQTAHYLAEQLRKVLPASIEIRAITGELSPEAREEQIAELARAGMRVLIATDCLSEGINLQEHFNAVLHYDLAWNPTRHEQREGRVDRFGQPSSKVKVITLYGKDNPIDGILLDVLIRKHQTIRGELGYSIPIPASTSEVMDAMFEGLLLRERRGHVEAYLPGFEEMLRPQKDRVSADLAQAKEREKATRSMFAQLTIKPEEVARELDAARAAAGGASEVARFVSRALPVYKAAVETPTGASEPLRIHLQNAPDELKDALGERGSLRAVFSRQAREGETYLHRTHPLVQNLCAYVQDSVLDEHGASGAARAGAILSKAVSERCAVLLLRYRFSVTTSRKGREQLTQLVEDYGLLAFSGSPEAPVWLSAERACELIGLEASRNIAPSLRQIQLEEMLEGYPALLPYLEADTTRRAAELLAAHSRVRDAARARGITYKVEEHQPPDLIGLYLYVPDLGGSL